jgi:hypothetical protein
MILRDETTPDPDRAVLIPLAPLVVKGIADLITYQGQQDTPRIETTDDVAGDAIGDNVPPSARPTIPCRPKNP